MQFIRFTLATAGVVLRLLIGILGIIFAITMAIVSIALKR